MAATNPRSPTDPLPALPDLNSLDGFTLGAGLESPHMPWLPAAPSTVGGLQGGAPGSGAGAFAASDALLDFLQRNGSGGMANERAFDAFASGSSAPVPSAYPAPSPFLAGQPGSQYTGTSTMSSAMTDDTWDDSFSFTPLISPAMTPMSVFSTTSLAPKAGGFGGSVAPEAVFSPLTSPALRPQPQSVDAVPPLPGMGPPLNLQRLIDQAHELHMDPSHRHDASSPNTAANSPTEGQSPASTTSRGRGASRTAPKMRPSPILKPMGRGLGGVSPASLPSGVKSKRSSLAMTPASSPIYAPASSSSALVAGSSSAISTPSPIDDLSVVVPTAAGLMLPPPLPGSSHAPATPASLMHLPLDLPWSGVPSSSDFVVPSLPDGNSMDVDPGPSQPTPAPRGKAAAGSTKKGKQPARKSARATAASAADDDDGGPGDRRSYHKVAEQRRRDSLKNCFEQTRTLLPYIPPEEDEEAVRRPGEGNVGGQRAFDPELPNKGVSKVALLRKSNEYIVKLHSRIERRDAIIDALLAHANELRHQLGVPDDDRPAGLLSEIDWTCLDGEETVWPWGSGGPGGNGHPPDYALPQAREQAGPAPRRSSKRAADKVEA